MEKGAEMQSCADCDFDICSACVELACEFNVCGCITPPAAQSDVQPQAPRAEPPAPVPPGLQPGGFASPEPLIAEPLTFAPINLQRVPSLSGQTPGFFPSSPPFRLPAHAFPIVPPSPPVSPSPLLVPPSRLACSYPESACNSFDNIVQCQTSTAAAMSLIGARPRCSPDGLTDATTEYGSMCSDPRRRGHKRSISISSSSSGCGSSSSSSCSLLAGSSPRLHEPADGPPCPPSRCCSTSSICSGRSTTSWSGQPCRPPKAAAEEHSGEVHLREAKALFARMLTPREGSQSSGSERGSGDEGSTSRRPASSGPLSARAVKPLSPRAADAVAGQEPLNVERPVAALLPLNGSMPRFPPADLATPEIVFARRLRARQRS